MSLLERLDNSRGERKDKFFYSKGINFAQRIQKKQYVKTGTETKCKISVDSQLHDSVNQHGMTADKMNKIKVTKAYIPPTLSRPTTYKGKFDSKSHDWVQNQYTGPQRVEVRLKSRDKHLNRKE